MIDAKRTSPQGKLVKTTYITKIVRTLFSFETLLVLFLFAGRYKADPRFAWIPVDITVLTFGLSTITGVYILWKKRFRVRRQVFTLSLLMAIFVIYTTVSLAWTPSITYARQKTLYLGTLAMFPLIACAWIITADRRRLRRFFYLIVLTAFWFAIEITTAYFQQGGGRIKVLGSSYLGIGRAFGMAVLIILIFTLFYMRRSKMIAGLILLPFFFFQLLIVGGRGPFVATIIAGFTPLLIGLQFHLSGKMKIKRYAIALLVFIVIGCLVVFSLIANSVVLTSLDRLLTLFDPVEMGGRNVAIRLSYYQSAISFWSKRPFFGHGVGSWPILVGLPDSQAYPHNIILEILVELGAFGLIVYSIMFLYAIRQLGSLSTVQNDPWRLLILMLLVQAFISAMISGDISDNRFLYGILGLMCIPKGSENAVGPIKEA